MKLSKSIGFAFALFGLAAVSAADAQSGAVPEPSFSNLAAGFRSPPDWAKAKTWWHWMSGCVSREGIRADLQAMKSAGLGGAILFHVGQLPIDSPVKFQSAEWWDLMRFASAEADHLGLELGFHNCPGWSSSGGPWIPVEKSMQKVVAGVQRVTGPSLFEGIIPKPQLDTNWNYYVDIAVLGIPDQTNAVPLSAIHDLSDMMQADGSLSWDAPAGDWLILRFGHTTTGKQCAPAPPGAAGLECDKLDRQGVDAHFDGYVARVLENAGPATGKTLNAVLIDSYEVGDQNWSPSFREEFRKRREYDILPWLVTFVTNRVVESKTRTERFEQDLKRTIAELFAENYFGYMAERVHRYPGLKLGIEPYWGPFDTATVGTLGDEVAGEYWQSPAPWGWETLKPVASCARMAGIRIVGAEAFTGQPQNAQWQQDPYALKATGDKAFCLGVNQLILHTTAHQPWTNVWPGMTMGFWGTHFGRTQTWWNQASAWLAYLARCQFLLQQGKFVGDVCFLSPGGGPANLHLPPGYDGDVCGEQTLLNSMTVEKGRVKVSSGMAYRVLVLPDRDTMTPSVARKIRDLVNAGATVLGPKRPMSSPSLQDYPACDQEVKQIGAELWDSGRVISGKSLGSVLAQLGVKPDVQADAAGIPWIHRRIGNADIYFISNQEDSERQVKCTFRIEGKQPELWDPATGEIREARNFTINNGLTSLLLKLDPRGSTFVVFEKPARRGRAGRNWDEFNTAAEFPGAWTVHFDPRWGGPGAVQFGSLTEWTRRPEPGIRYYSGTATYEKEFDAPETRRGERVYIDLGAVKNLASVQLNGVPLGVAWKPPFRLEATRALRAGRNKLEVRVTNLWPNRMIGDEHHRDDCVWDKAKDWDQSGPSRVVGWPLKEIPAWLTQGQQRPSTNRYTFSSFRFFTKDSPLLESGLLGPVRLLVAEPAL